MAMPINCFRYDGPLPWRTYYFFYEQYPDHELARIIGKSGLRPHFFNGGWSRDDFEPYTIFRCSVPRKKADLFEDCMEKRMRLAMVTGDDEYVEFGKNFTRMYVEALELA